MGSIESAEGGWVEPRGIGGRETRLASALHFKGVALHGPVRSRFLRLLPNIAVSGLLEELSEALDLLRTERDRGAEQAMRAGKKKGGGGGGLDNFAMDDLALPHPAHNPRT